MEDENKAKKIINMTILIISIALIIVISIIVYTKIMQKINNDKFTSYIINNNYTKNEDGIYTKKIDQNDTTITYQAIIDQYLLSKNDITINNNGLTNITVGYKLDGTIEISYTLEGHNNNQTAVLHQKGTYKNNEFKCEIINNNGLQTQCQQMKKRAQNFEKEINQIFESNNINSKYITLKDKNAV